MITRDDIYFLANQQVASRDELFAQVAELMLAQGRVKESYQQALAQRELEFPTGLPLPGGVAIPHTAAEHVISDALVVVTLPEPIDFHEMGGDEEDFVSVSLVIFLVLSDGKAHLNVLSNLITALQTDSFREQLAKAESEETVKDALMTVVEAQ